LQALSAARPSTNTKGKEKAIVISDDEIDELVKTPVRSQPRISDLLNYSSEAEEASTSEDETPPPRRKDREKATADDIASRPIYDLETGQWTDAEEEIDLLREAEAEAEAEAATATAKRRRFESFIDNND
jgi:hypothetical protein